MWIDLALYNWKINVIHVAQILPKFLSCEKCRVSIHRVKYKEFDRICKVSMTK